MRTHLPRELSIPVPIPGRPRSQASAAHGFATGQVLQCTRLEGDPDESTTLGRVSRMSDPALPEPRVNAWPADGALWCPAHQIGRKALGGHVSPSRWRLWRRGRPVEAQPVDLPSDKVGLFALCPIPGRG